MRQKSEQRDLKGSGVAASRKKKGHRIPERVRKPVGGPHLPATYSPFQDPGWQSGGGNVYNSNWASVTHPYSARELHACNRIPLLYKCVS